LAWSSRGAASGVERLRCSASLRLRERAACCVMVAVWLFSPVRETKFGVWDWERGSILGIYDQLWNIRKAVMTIFHKHV